MAENTITAREVRSLLRANHPLWQKPRTAFLEDLGNVLEAEKKEGRAIFIGGDFNSNIKDEDIQQFMAKYNLFNLLDSSDLSASTSCTRSSQGSGFIDIAMGSSEFFEALLSSGGRAFYADNWSDHRIVELCFSKSLLFGTLKNEPRKTRHFNIKNRKQRELFLKTLQDLHEASGTLKSIRSCLDSFSGSGSLKLDEAIQLMKKLKERSVDYMRKANSTAAPPVSKFRYRHSDALANAGQALHHANHLLQTDPDNATIKEAKELAKKNLDEVKRDSDKYRVAMANGKSLDAMD